jgi:hypothetical protein
VAEDRGGVDEMAVAAGPDDGEPVHRDDELARLQL